MAICDGSNAICNQNSDQWPLMCWSIFFCCRLQMRIPLNKYQLQCTMYITQVAQRELIAAEGTKLQTVKCDHRERTCSCVCVTTNWLWNYLFFFCLSFCLCVTPPNCAVTITLSSLSIIKLFLCFHSIVADAVVVFRCISSHRYISMMGPHGVRQFTCSIVES